VVVGDLEEHGGEEFDLVGDRGEVVEDFSVVVVAERGRGGGIG